MVILLLRWSVQILPMANPILPRDLLTEILSRLPVKSLLKLRCVSKSWLSLISNSEFIKTHLSFSTNKEDTHHVLIWDIGGEKRKYKEFRLKSLFLDSVSEAHELDFPIGNDSNRLYFMGSCNGLVYLADTYADCSLIWNPTTRKHKNLPPFRHRAKKPVVPLFGFGYDELHDDYKVVIISYNDVISCSDDIEVKVYSLKIGSWTSVDYFNEETFFIKKSPGYCGEILCYLGVFVSGRLHWGTGITDRPTDVIFDSGRNIIAFDLANEKWEKVEKPSSYEEGETESLVGMLGSDLSIFCHYKKTCDYKPTHVGVWVMKEYGVKESWIKVFNIMYPPNDQEWYPTFFMSNKGEVLSMFGATSMIYNSKDDSVVYSDVTNCDYCHCGQLYIESLVCPFSIEGTENTAKESRKKPVSKEYFLFKCFKISVWYFKYRTRRTCEGYL